MHSSGVRTARLLIVSQHVLDGEGVFAQEGSAGRGVWQTPHGTRGKHPPLLLGVVKRGKKIN